MAGELYTVIDIAVFWVFPWDEDHDPADPPELDPGDFVMGLSEPVYIYTGKKTSQELDEGHWEMRVLSRLGPGWVNVIRLVGVVL